VVGITGGSGAGKSALVRGLAERMEAAVITLDSYYVDRSEVPWSERERLNFDAPEAIDLSLLVTQLCALAAHEPIDRPVYCFATHCRTGTERVSPARVVIVEGLFALWWPELRSLFDVKIFVDAPSDLRLVRRIRRDVAERGRDVEQVLRQYMTAVRPMYERYVEPARQHADLVITNDGAIGDAITHMARLVSI
jgi:uridine kinase